MIEVDPTVALLDAPRLGAPVTGFKRLLLRLLRQYTSSSRRSRRASTSPSWSSTCERLENASAIDRGSTRCSRRAGPYDAVSGQALAWRELLAEHGYGGT